MQSRFIQIVDCNTAHLSCRDIFPVRMLADRVIILHMNAQTDFLPLLAPGKGYLQ